MSIQKFKSSDTMTAVVVEDDDVMRQLIVRLLLMIGFSEVVEANEGSHGLMLIAATNPKLVVCDLNMGSVCGMSVLGAIRHSMKPISAVPFVFFSGTVDQKVTRNARELGAHGVLKKPINPTVFSQFICDLMVATHGVTLVASHDD